LIHRVERQDDPRLDRYRHVGDPHWLRDRGLFVAEGRLVVERLLAQGGYVVDSILATPAAFDALGPEAAGAHDVLVAPQQIVDGVAGIKFHRGCLALVRRPADADLARLEMARRLIVLEGVGNPDNVGGIFRSAAAFGVDGIILGPACVDPFYRKAVRTSMGAVLRVPFARASAWPDVLGDLKRKGHAVVALSPTGAESIDACAASLAGSARLALLAGAEGPGLSAGASAAADVVLRIPVDPRSDSLNVVVALSIAMQRLCRV
jgi:tRNA G18 (ribose-2'-O)-methylase SpoU